jgi:hypothetical protein
VLCCAVLCCAVQFPKEDYAGEMHLLSRLQREQVVANIRSISHAMQRSVLRQLAVMPHQALPGVYEARLYDEPVPGAPSTTYKVGQPWCGSTRLLACRLAASLRLTKHGSTGLQCGLFIMRRELWA